MKEKYVKKKKCKDERRGQFENFEYYPKTAAVTTLVFIFSQFRRHLLLDSHCII